MTASRKSILLLFALTLLGGVSRAGANENRHPGVGGRVLAETSPLAAAGVYAWQLTDLTLKKVLTDPKGNFLFQDLPAGLYKIIAHKPGFVPVVVVLTRTTAQTYQFVEIQLAEQQRGVAGAAGSAQDDFWSVRSQIPGDVLREIQADEGERTASASDSLPSLQNITASQKLDLHDVAKAGFSTSWQAMTGVDQIASNSGGLVSGAGVGIEGKLGQTQVGLRGSFWQLSGDAAGRPGSLANTGQASTLSLDLARGTGSRISVTSLNNRMGRRTDDGEAPIDLEHYTVNWTQDVGKNGRSDFAAQYTAENNYHRQAAIEPAEIPEASRAWRVEGAYTMALGDSNTLQTGVRYREIELGTATLGRPLGDPDHDRVRREPERADGARGDPPGGAAHPGRGELEPRDRGDGGIGVLAQVAPERAGERSAGLDGGMEVRGPEERVPPRGREPRRRRKLVRERGEYAPRPIGVRSPRVGRDGDEPRTFRGGQVDVAERPVRIAREPVGHRRIVQ